MSGAGERRSASSSAAVIRDDAAAWVAERSLSEHWDDRKQAAFENWLAESTANEVAYVRMEATWERTGRLAILKGAAPDNERAQTKRTRSTYFSIALAIAAILLVAGGAGFVLRGNAMRTYSTAVGEHKTLNLADGSRIELNTNTVLQASATNERSVWLRKGEAYFQIRHDTKHPFVVMVGDRRIVDLGTKFIVRQDVNQLDVSVVEGRIGFAAKNESAQPLLLNAGDGVVATPNAISVIKKPAQEMAHELSWRNGMLIFRHTALAQAAREFNRYNREQIVVGDAAAHLTIDGTFPMNDVRAFSEVAQAVFGLRVERRAGETVISR